eukprot:531681-Amphidinium_carterae.1
MSNETMSACNHMLQCGKTAPKQFKLACLPFPKVPEAHRGLHNSLYGEEAKDTAYHAKQAQSVITSRL